MKKKVMLLSLVLSLLFAGVVSAASLWGTYKGKNIIRLTIDGIPVKVSDAPAVSMDGRTMIPIYLLQQAGINYSWDASSQTVNISKTTSDFSKVKSLVAIMDYYGALKDLGNLFIQVDKQLTLDLNYLINPLDIQAILTNASNNIDSVINEYNRLQQMEQVKLMTATSINQNEILIDQVVSSYSKAIDYFKKAYDNLKSYSNDSSVSTDFFTNMKSASDLYFSGIDSSLTGYTKYYNLIQNLSSAPSTSTPIINTPVPSNSIETNNTVNSKIDGDFDGFDNGKIFKLTNGQIWQQTDYTYKYSYKYSPKVTIYKDGTKYKMIVDGVDKTVTVERLK